MHTSVEPFRAMRARCKNCKCSLLLHVFFMGIAVGYHIALSVHSELTCAGFRNSEQNDPVKSVRTCMTGVRHERNGTLLANPWRLTEWMRATARRLYYSR